MRRVHRKPHSVYSFAQADGTQLSDAAADRPLQPWAAHRKKRQAAGKARRPSGGSKPTEIAGAIEQHATLTEQPFRKAREQRVQNLETSQEQDMHVMSLRNTRMRQQRAGTDVAFENNDLVEVIGQYAG